MKVYRIWNETKQEWLTTNKTIWTSERNAKLAISNIKVNYSFRNWVFKIFEYELCNEKEIAESWIV